MSHKKENCNNFENGYSKEVWLYDGSLYDSQLDARWACFFDVMGIDYNYKSTHSINYKYKSKELFISDNEFFLPTFSTYYIDRHTGETKILLIDVVENWTLPRIQWLKDNPFPVFIIGDLPEDYSDASSHFDFEREEIIYQGIKTGLVENNFYHIDGDFFGCFFGTSEKGKVRLCGCDSNYWTKSDRRHCDAALYYAQNMMIGSFIERF